MGSRLPDSEIDDLTVWIKEKKDSSSFRDFLLEQLPLLTQWDEQVDEEAIKDILACDDAQNLNTLKILPTSDALRILKQRPYYAFDLLDYYWKEKTSANQRDDLPDWDTLYEIASSIPQGHYHYKKAQAYCQDILAAKVTIPSSESKPEEIAAHRDNLKMRLQSAVNEENYEKVNELFDALCNSSISGEQRDIDEF